MKNIITFLLCSFTAMAVLAQQTSTVTINVKGNRNKEILVDGYSYTVNTDVSSATAVNAPITISGLTAGQHTLQIRRSNQYNNSTTLANTTTFTVRTGYDLTITINSNGSIQQTEKRTRRNTNYPGAYNPPMSDQNFSVILSDIQRLRTNNSRLVAINNAFNNPANYFTSMQAHQLISLINSQPNRLTVAKTAYKTITDPASFTTRMSDLIVSQASRRDLDAYVWNYDQTNRNTGTVKTPMSATNFNSLYISASQQYSTTAKVNYIANAFANSNNYFTTTQTRQLIQLVTAENDRLTLAKGAWDNLADPANYAQLYDLFTSTYYRNEFIAYANSNGTYTGTTVVKQAMSDQDFNNMVRKISNRWGLGVKMQGLTEEFNKTENNFTTAQARQLIQLVSDETNRLQLGKLAYDNIVDRNNFYQLYDILASQASRDELDAYVKANYSTTTPYPVRTAMTGESFTSIYNDVSNRWGLSAKMSALTGVFANSSYNFTTAQTRQLIQLVSSETNRLELAKSSYDNIVDPENFSQIYDLFTSQASRNELAAYVSAYSYNR